MPDATTLIETLSAHSSALAALGHKVRFDLSDLDTSILLDASGGTTQVSETKGDAEAILTLSSDTLDKLISGRLGPMLAFTTGRLKLAGSQGVALKLAGLLEGLS